MSIKTQNVKPISAIRQEQAVDDKAKIAKLEREKRDLMLAVTDLYEQNLALEDKNRIVMLALTDVYEMVLPLLPEEGGTP